MPIPTPGAETFHASISLPAGADAQTRASFSTPIGQLADRTKFMRAYLSGDASEFVYPTSILGAPKTRKLTITPASVGFVSRGNAGASYAEHWFPTRSGGYPILCPVVDAAELFVPIGIPSGCTISKVEVLVRSSTARTGANRWSVKVYEQSEPWGSPAAPTATQQGSTTEGGGSSGYSVIDVASLTPFIRVAEYTAHVLITGPTGSLPGAGTDQFLAVRVSFTDGGPRNA
jgi:hypothetical protein